MPKIVRCPDCLSTVYEGDERCHHCGETLNRSRRRFLPRGAWAFIAVAVIGFGTYDAVDLLHEKRIRTRHDAFLIEDFTKAWLQDKKSTMLNLWWHKRWGEDPLEEIREIRDELDLDPCGRRITVGTPIYLGKKNVASRFRGAVDSREGRCYRTRVALSKKGRESHSLEVEAVVWGPHRCPRILSFHLPGDPTHLSSVANR